MSERLVRVILKDQAKSEFERLNKIEVVAFVLYLIDHPTYNKLFGYRKK